MQITQILLVAALALLARGAEGRAFAREDVKGVRTVFQDEARDDPFFDPNPQYDFSYRIHDAQTGDAKDMKEERHGDSVQGRYSLVDPDGTLRVVQYTADDVHGFNAVVSLTPGHAKPIVPPLRSIQQRVAVMQHHVDVPVPVKHIVPVQTPTEIGTNQRAQVEQQAQHHLHQQQLLLQPSGATLLHPHQLIQNAPLSGIPDFIAPQVNPQTGLIQDQRAGPQVPIAPYFTQQQVHLGGLPSGFYQVPVSQQEQSLAKQQEGLKLVSQQQLLGTQNTQGIQDSSQSVQQSIQEVGQGAIQNAVVQDTVQNTVLNAVVQDTVQNTVQSAIQDTVQNTVQSAIQDTVQHSPVQSQQQATTTNGEEQQDNKLQQQEIVNTVALPQVIEVRHSVEPMDSNLVPQEQLQLRSSDGGVEAASSTFSSSSTTSAVIPRQRTLAVYRISPLVGTSANRNFITFSSPHAQYIVS